MQETLLCQRVYVEAMLDYLEQGGKSRGSAMYIDPQGHVIQNLPSFYRFQLDGEEHAEDVQEVQIVHGKTRISWRKIRPIPAEDESFEKVWKAYRERQNAKQEASR